MVVTLSQRYPCHVPVFASSGPVTQGDGRYNSYVFYPKSYLEAVEFPQEFGSDP